MEKDDVASADRLDKSIQDLCEFVFYISTIQFFTFVSSPSYRVLCTFVQLPCFKCVNILASLIDLLSGFEFGRAALLCLNQQRVHP